MSNMCGAYIERYKVEEEDKRAVDGTVAIHRQKCG